jgi:hypothetical protein
MKKVLLSFNNRLEHQAEVMGQLFERLTALEQALLTQWHLHQLDASLAKQVETFRPYFLQYMANVHRDHQELRELISQVPD